VEVWIVGEQAFELGTDGHTLRTFQYTDYTRQYVRKISPTADHLRQLWPIAERRADIIDQLAQRGIDLETLAKAANQPEADPLDLLVHVAYNGPLLTRRERAQQLRAKRANFFNAFTPSAREVLEVLLDKYADYGLKQLTNWNEVLKIPPLADQYSVMEIAQLFGGPEKVREAVERMQSLLYESP
jgi:type I restriction enzyme, R subunit